MIDNILLLPLCVGVSGVGLVLSYLAWRRRGLAAGMRGAAWSLLPIAAYLTGALSVLWGIGTAVAGYVTGVIANIINPLMWAGVAVAGLSAVLFVVSGVLRRRGGGGRKAEARPVEQKQAEQKQAESAGKPAVAAPQKRTNDDDFSDIEEILRKRGIG